MSDGDMAAAQVRMEDFGWSDSDVMTVDGVEHFHNNEGFEDYECFTARIHTCPRCGGAVLNRERHMDWHEEVGR